MRNRFMSCLGLALAAGCVAEGGVKTIEVTKDNHLGVAAIETEHFVVNGDPVFELRGLDAAGNQVAVVRLRNGSIPELPVIPNVDDSGSELTTAVAGVETSMQTRETQRFELEPDPGSPLETLLAIDAVSSTLEHDANIFVVLPTEAAPEAPQVAQQCSTYDLLQTPLAVQCCYSFDSSAPNFGGTKFYYAAVNKIVSRKINPQGTGCKASDGISSCLGGACYYGPLGYSRPTQTNPPTPYWKIINLQQPDKCSVGGYSTPQTPIFGNVTGYYANGQGCPGGNSGGQWDVGP